MTTYTYTITATNTMISTMDVTYIADNGTTVVKTIPAPRQGQSLTAHVASYAPEFDAPALETRDVPDVGTTGVIEFGTDRGFVGISVPPMDLDAIKLNRKNGMNDYRERLLAAGVEYDGHVFDTDPVTISRLTALSVVVGSGVPLPPGFVWRSKNNVDVPFTGTDVVTLLALCISEANRIFQVSWSKKLEIDAATTVQAVGAIEWEDPICIPGVKGSTVIPVFHNTVITL